MDYISIQEQTQHYVRSLFDAHIEGKLIYHNLYHTEKVVEAATEIAGHYNLTGRDLFIVTVAAWFHDTGYLTGLPSGHEERGAGMMEAFLSGTPVDPETVAAIRGCILATKMPQSHANMLENIVCDADLFHLGTDEFVERNKLMRKEAGIFQGRKIGKEEWRKGTILFLESHHYRTDYCQSKLAWKQHEHLAALLAKEESASDDGSSGKHDHRHEDKDGYDDHTDKMVEENEEGQLLLTSQANKKNKNGAGRGVETMFKIASTNHQRLSRQADSKAHILIQVNSIIISVLLSLLLRKIDDHMNLVIPGILLLTVNLLTIIFSILATRPHISGGTFSKTDLETRKVNLLFFGNFYNMGLPEFTEGMKQVMDDPDFLYGSLVKDLYFQGIALGRKFRWLRLSYNIFMFGLIIAVVSFVTAALLSPNKWIWLLPWLSVQPNPTNPFHMQNVLLNIAESLEGAELVDSGLSFGPFLEFLKERQKHEKTMKAKFLEWVIGHFESRLPAKKTVAIEEVGEYEDLLQLIYSTIFPVIADERENLWSLSLPVKPYIFYGTELFYELMQDKKTGALKAEVTDIQMHERKKINLEFIYSLVLKKFYNYLYAPPYGSFIHSLQDTDSGLSMYFRLNVDTRFVEILLKGPLPDIKPETLSAHLLKPDALAYLREQLPLSLFRFEGISAITVTDITAEYALENIKNIILDRSDCDKDTHYEDVIRSLKALAGRKDIGMGLMPLVKVNDKPVYPEETCTHSMLAVTAAKYGEVEETYMSLAEGYIQDPKLIFFEKIPEPTGEDPLFLTMLRRSGIQSYGLLPVFYNNHLAGVLEVYSMEEGVLDREVLSRLDIALPILAQLLQHTIDEINLKIESIIKENFTSIQPAVEWKFNEAAWHFLKQHWQGDQRPVLETIYFKNVYPLYGAIDIRNSTVERNSALRKDLETQFDILEKTLSNLQQAVNLELLEELIFRCKKWQHLLTESLTTADEMELNNFLKNEIEVFFTHFGESRPEAAPIIKVYLDAINESDGAAFVNRRELETSLQSINKTINRHLESSMVSLQRSYPAYFEKFRTDGVEYDIYIGQPIAPDIPFDILYLKNLRLWQLSSMATIARLTNALLPDLPAKLQTTQLIFVHSNPIDISFRKDERRFDVEGGYNIRYQVVKKRIDKVHVLGGNERLTQPGKIAVIYFNDKEGAEYAGYIKYLQEKDVLEGDLEELELEELQGVSGLKAFRVGVKLG